MNTQQLAEELGVHYQTVSRVARKYQRARGKEGSGTMGSGGLHFSPEFEALVRRSVINLHLQDTRRAIRSTDEERREWLKVWEPAFENASYDKWASFSMVVVCIRKSKVHRWLDAPLGAYRRGDHVLHLALTAGADLDAEGKESGFTAWLMDHGFTVWKYTP